MPDSSVSSLGDLTGMNTAVPKIHCSVEAPQLTLNGMLRTSCNRAMAAGSLAQAHFPCCFCAPNILENSIDRPVALLEEESYV